MDGNQRSLRGRTLSHQSEGGSHASSQCAPEAVCETGRDHDRICNTGRGGECNAGDEQPNASGRESHAFDSESQSDSDAGACEQRFADSEGGKSNPSRERIRCRECDTRSFRNAESPAVCYASDATKSISRAVADHGSGSKHNTGA